MNSFLKKFITSISLLALFIFLVHKAHSEQEGFLEKMSFTLTYPFLWTASQISNYWQSCCEKKESYHTLKQSHDNLKECYEQVLAENIKLRAMLHYEHLSKDLRAFQERYHLDDKLVAKVLIKNITDEEHFFIINKGASTGVKPDMVAIYKFQIVGRVTTVHDYYSKVLLITDQTCKVSAYTSVSHAEGILRGRNDIKACSLIYVNHLLSIVNRDIVVSSGQGLVFPEGFSLGQIVSLTLPPKSLYYEIIVKPLIDLQSINFVLLIDQAKLNIF